MSRIRRAAVVVTGAGACVALLAPVAHADITQTFGPRTDCVTNAGNTIFCYTASGYVTISDPPSGSNLLAYATMHLELTCTGVVPCQPINQTVPIPTTGVVPGSPSVTLNTIYTLPSDFLCLNQTCVPGFPVNVVGPQVEGDLATLWVAGNEIPVRIPDQVPDPMPIVDGAADLVVGAVNSVTREVGIHINLDLE